MYTRRPINDGDRWIQGYHYTKPRQSRGNPLASVVRYSGGKPLIRNLGPNNTTEWKPLSPSTIIEMCLKGSLTVRQVETFIARGVYDRTEFRVDFIAALKEATISGELGDPVGLLQKYQEALLGW